jgi:uncharacterized membrane protein YfcA
LELWQAVLIVGAGLAAGVINAVAGAGTLITFPALLALGYPPLVANVSNTVGLIPASITGALGFRKELAGQWRELAKMVVASAIGGITGAILLLILPSETFGAVVPFLLIAAAILAAIQPRVARCVRARSAEAPESTRRVNLPLLLAVFFTGIYGGYFGAAQGVILLALLGILWSTDLHRANGAKNVLAGVANVVSATLFVASGAVDWFVAVLVGVGAACGGFIGAKIGRRIPAPLMRAILVVVALIAATVLIVTN